MNRKTSTAATAAPIDLPCNPHCAQSYPFGHFEGVPAPWRHSITELRRDVLAIMTLADLLRTDESIADNARNSDDAASEPQPFTPFVRDGLTMALGVCADAANGWLEWIEMRAIDNMRAKAAAT